MKKILLLIFIFIGIQGYCQEQNFKVDNGTLNWSHVYQDSLSADAVYKNLRVKLNHDEFTFQENEIQFTVNFTTEDLKPYGYTRSKYPVFINEGYIKGFVEFKENRYKTTIKSIHVKNVLGSIYSDSDDYNNINHYFIKKGVLTQRKSMQKVIATFDLFFSNTFNTSEAKKDDW
jgi:hypothetical protein